MSYFIYFFVNLFSFYLKMGGQEEKREERMRGGGRKGGRERDGDTPGHLLSRQLD